MHLKTTQISCTVETAFFPFVLDAEEGYPDGEQP